ncbi:AAA family ATPase [Methylobacterium hispanicum]|uniref:ATP-binding protein n=1 Tax=Methylobacterium TaxID=407 RepID=UPI0012E3330A|nr:MULTISPECIES: ATP-binding protein [Methylobacterium]
MPYHKAIYVTGAPAAGKSSTMSLLKERVAGLNVWEYGERLTNFLKSAGVILKDQNELRSLSAGVVLPSHIEALDERLLEWTVESRATGPTVIDSHPVTKEQYGFRVTAFSAERFRLLRPDEIWLFYVDPEITVRRIADDPAGRPMISLEQARIHSFMQASVACTFGICVGCPVYMFDTNRDRAELVEDLVRRVSN